MKVLIVTRTLRNNMAAGVDDVIGEIFKYGCVGINMYEDCICASYKYRQIIWYSKKVVVGYIDEIHKKRKMRILKKQNAMHEMLHGCGRSKVALQRDTLNCTV